MTRVAIRLVLLILGVALMPLAAIAAVRLQFDIRIADMTRDVAAIANIHPLKGALSSLGILLWWSSATVWFFAAGLRRLSRADELVPFYIYAGSLSAYFALDDFFQFHEYLAPTYLYVPELTVYGLMAVAMAVFLKRFWKILYRSDGLIFLVALCLLAGSVIIDAVLGRWLWRLGDWIYMLEDGLKWLGICFWFSFCLVRSVVDLAPNAALSRRTAIRRTSINGGHALPTR